MFASLLNSIGQSPTGENALELSSNDLVFLRAGFLALLVFRGSFTHLCAQSSFGLIYSTDLESSREELGSPVQSNSWLANDMADRKKAAPEIERRFRYTHYSSVS